MHIEKIILTNFKRHKYLEVDFTTGVNTIVGSNYSGKSTILQAVLVGLFGNSVVPGTEKNMTHDDAKSFEIKMSLSNGTLITRKPKNAYISNVSEPNLTSVRGSTPVNEYIREMIGIDKGSFMKIYASEQGQPQQLLNMEGAKLQKFVEMCTGLDTLEGFISACRGVVKENKIRSVTVMDLLPDDVEADARLVIKKLAEHKSSELQTQISYSREKAKQHFLEADKLREQYEEARDSQLKISNYEAEVKGLKASMPDKLRGIDFDLDEIICQEIEHSKIVLDTRRSYELYEAANKSLIPLQKKQYDSQQAVDGLNKWFENLEIIEDVSEASGEKDLQLGILLQDIKKARSSLRDSYCPECERPFDLDSNHKATLQGKLDGLEAKLVEVKRDSVSLLRRVTDYKKQAEDTLKYEQDRGIKNHQLDATTQEIKENNLIMSNNQSRPDAPESEQILSKVRHLIAYAKEVELVDKRRDEILYKLNRMERPKPYVGMDISQIKKSLQEETEMGQHCSAEDAKLSTALELSKRKSREEDIFEKAWRSNLAKLEEYDSIADEHAELLTILQDNRESFIKNTWDYMFSVTTDFVAMCTGGTISKVYMTDDGIRYTENGMVRPVASASGSQKTLMGIGMKLGLSHKVPCLFSCLILDEISADMDPSISSACLSALKSMCNQALIVTHEAMDGGDSLIQLN